MVIGECSYGCNEEVFTDFLQGLRLGAKGHRGMFPSSLLRGSVFYTCNEIVVSPSPHQSGKLCECYLVGHGALFQHSHRALRNNSVIGCCSSFGCVFGGELATP